jgi:hypothetical protein
MPAGVPAFPALQSKFDAAINPVIEFEAKILGFIQYSGD